MFRFEFKFMKQSMLIFRVFCVGCLIYPTVVAKLPPKIAIIGGGIGGTSCAYFLSQIFEDKAELTLYERDTIGGRLHLLNVDGDLFESGGSVIHPKNKYMMEFTKLLGLGLRKPISGRFGIYDGKQFVFQESEWFFITMFKFFWRYGFSPLSLDKQVQSILNDFFRIYDLQDKEYSFTTVTGLLDAMSSSFRNMTQESLASILTKKSLSKYFVDELVQSVMMVNYGQTNDISGFAGFVSLAGTDNNIWSVYGGNKLVPEGLLKMSKASVKNADVSEITLESDGTYSLKYSETFSEKNLTTDYYDIIIIASPMIKDKNNIKFLNFQKDFSQYQSTFHRTVTTFVQGNLNISVFNDKNVPQEILTFKDSLAFNSLSKVSPVSDYESKGKKSVYKIFSQKPLSTENIKYFFEDIDAIKEKDWLGAYPHYKPPEHLPPFMLQPGLYYTNAIELSASAMEMSAVAAKNVALLAFNMWHHLIDKVDNYKHISKDEL